jgi:hypothetical protein
MGWKVSGVAQLSSRARSRRLGQSVTPTCRWRMDYSLAAHEDSLAIAPPSLVLPPATDPRCIYPRQLRRRTFLPPVSQSSSQSESVSPSVSQPRRVVAAEPAASTPRDRSRPPATYRCIAPCHLANVCVCLHCPSPRCPSAHRRAKPHGSACNSHSSSRRRR